jgi:peroxiredoxin
LKGIYNHLADRAAVVVVSPDPPEVQQRFAQSRGWKFPMVSHRAHASR